MSKRTVFKVSMQGINSLASQLSWVFSMYHDSIWILKGKDSKPNAVIAACVIPVFTFLALVGAYSFYVLYEESENGANSKALGKKYLNQYKLSLITWVGTVSSVLEDAGCFSSLGVILEVTGIIDREENWFHWTRLVGTVLLTGAALVCNKPEYSTLFKSMKSYYGYNDSEKIPLNVGADNGTNGGTFNEVIVEGAPELGAR